MPPTPGPDAHQPLHEQGSPPPGAQPGDQWRTQRAAAVSAKQAALARQLAEEAALTRLMLLDFVRQAMDAGIEQVALRAQPYSGRATYRTGLSGWYLKRDHSLAVCANGDYYLLKVPVEAMARIRGIRLAPSPAPVIVGRGARDGESIDLKVLLELRLAAGNDYP